MSPQLSLEAAPSGLDAVLRARGFERLTPIQAAVLDPAHQGRDLRICSQTGAGKTVAIGLVLAERVRAHADARADVAQAARPTALIVAPTRELATQLARELSWLFAPWRAGVVGVTGGAAYELELRGLRRDPAVVVGTPGRLLDHLRRSSLSLDALKALVLDEADEMLDMGFEEELEAILGFAPAEKQSLLVSATFGERVARIADRLQREPVWIHGTPLGAPNEDIEHVGVLVEGRHRADAVVNLLLRHPDDKTLVFVKTRVETHELAAFLAQQGFACRALSGEMTHRERTQTFDAFRSGAVRVLVATDVAARGLDVSDIARVIQVDPPQNAEVFTHRGGRTGRAGKQGQNVLLVPPRSRRRAEQLFREAGVRARFIAPPNGTEILAAADERLRDQVREGGSTERARELAAQLLAEGDAVDVVAHLLSRIAHTGPCAPRVLPEVRLDAAPRATTTKKKAEPRASEAFVLVQVSWGGRAGADPRRLLAVACRRGRVGRTEVGAITIGPSSSTIEIAAPAAERFEESVRRKDPRDPHVRFRRWLPPEARGRAAHG